jgi:PAS domain S-box-containing protein
VIEQDTGISQSRTRDQLVGQSLKLSKVLCFVSLVFPLATAVGWIFGIPVLTQGHPMLPAMPTDTAAGLALGALAVLSSRERAAAHRRTLVTLVLASAMLLLGLVTLGEYLFGWDTGIDRIFVHGAQALGQPFPGRPSPPSSLNFALLGAALIACSLGLGQPYLWQIAAIATAANAIVATAWYIFGINALFGLPFHAPAVGMAVHTAITFTILAVAFLCAQPSQGMMTLMTSDTHGGVMARRILLAGILAPPLVGVLTRIGVVAGWYDGGAQVSLFAFVMIGLILRTIWRAARRAEHEELLARAAFADIQSANDRLNRAIDERQVFAALIENSSDFIGIADPSGKPLYLNPAGRRMVGLAPDFPVGNTTIPEYYPPDLRQFASDVIIKSMVERGHWEGESAFRHWQTEQAIPVSDTAFMIRSPDTGRILGMGTITRDISDIKRAREEIEAVNRQLQTSNEQITRLYEKTRELDELKTTFFANVSHDFRTPLALILGPIEKHLSSPATRPDLRQDLEVVERSARTLLRHVEDLLDVARLDAGRLKPSYIETDAVALVRFVSDHFSVLAKEKNIEFTVDVPATLPVQVDRDKLQRMLLNLLSNAFKFTPRGGRVRISLGEIGGRFRVEVGDSGPGVPEEKRADVFERFQRLEAGATGPVAGTGLGLSIVRGFTELLDGSISIDVAPEGGALFVLDLPSSAPPGIPVQPGPSEPVDVRDVERLIEEVGEPRPVATTDEAPESDRHPLVLVVEDNPEMNRFIGDCLRSDGFEVAAAFDGLDGYHRAVDRHPDLVVTDLVMPNMTGDALVRSLRENAELRTIPIVVLTARADPDFRARLLRDGADDYLEKPFSNLELRARVRNLVSRKRAEDHANRLRQQIEDVALATKSVSEAVAGLPESSLSAVLQTIALKAQSLTSAEFAAVGIGSDPNRPFEKWAYAGINDQQAAMIGPYPRPVGVLGVVAKENRGICLQDLREHPAHRGFPPHHPVMTSFIGAPIRHRDRTIGNIYVANKREARVFTHQDQQLVEMLAESVGVAIETARLYSAEGLERAWLKAVVDQMPEGVVLMDAGGRVTVENRFVHALEAADRSGKRDRFGNRMTLDLRYSSGEPVSPEDLPIVKALVDKETTEGQELVARRPDGHMVPLLVEAAPIRSATGDLAGATMILQDVSTLKELEHLREEWAAIVAHDLQQPVHAILLRTELLLRGSLSDEEAEHVRHVRVAIARLSRMARDLLDASKLETKRMRITVDRLDLGELVHDIVKRIPDAQRRTRIRTLVGHPVIVRGDAQRLEQVITNLVSNALKYGVPGSEIQLDLSASDGHAQVSVTNQGPGIPADELPVIFERYGRSRAARMSNTQGLGLGLYIAKGLVEAHGGRIWAESVPGDTTTFNFTVPLDDR